MAAAAQADLSGGDPFRGALALGVEGLGIMAPDDSVSDSDASFPAFAGNFAVPACAAPGSGTGMISCAGPRKGPAPHHGTEIIP